jgi:hypothetical protein
MHTATAECRETLVRLAWVPDLKAVTLGATLGKLLSLKEWVTVPDAARRLSIVCGDDANESDVLQLALGGRLKLSVNFVNHTKARQGKVVPEDEAPTFWGCLSGQEIRSGFDLGDGTRLVLDDEIVTLGGIWDLCMLGAERLDIERAYHSLTGGPSVELDCLAGSFVEGRDGSIWQLQEHFKKNGNGGSLSTDDHYPASGLPEDGVLVVRTAALSEFEQSIDASKAKDQKPLSPTERNTLLVMIAALCEDVGIKHQDRTAASKLVRLADAIGVSVSDDTTRNVLRQIPEAIEARRK